MWDDVTETCATMVERARSLIDDWHLANGLNAESLTAAPAGIQPAAASSDIFVVTTVVPSVFLPTAASAIPAAAQPRWQPPEHGRMKCNIDAALSIQRNKTGVSICIRDEDGVFVLDRTVTFIGVYLVDIGEALGLYHALQWASDMHLDNIDFEVDSKTTKVALYSGLEDITEFGNIITTSGLCSRPSLPTLEWSLFGDKLMWWLTLSQGKPHFSLVPLFIFIYSIVLKL
jgi:hypothetical protein